MTDPHQYKTYPLEEAVRTQKALRELVTLGLRCFRSKRLLG
jgi:hypothetical protein